MAAEAGPRPEWTDAACAVCPAQVLPAGGFDVVDRPDRDRRYDPAVGYRVEAATGAAVVGFLGANRGLNCAEAIGTWLSWSG